MPTLCNEYDRVSKETIKKFSYKMQPRDVKMLDLNNMGKLTRKSLSNWLLDRTVSAKNEELEDALNSLDLALIYFGEDGELKTANCKACELIPELGNISGRLSGKCRSCKIAMSCKTKCDPILTLKDFLAYLFENSVDAMEQAGLYLETAQGQTSAFREIIYLDPDKYYLVRAIPQKIKGTIVELTDVSNIKIAKEHVVHLGQQNQVLTEAIQNITEGMLVADNLTPNKRILFMNKAFSELLEMDCDRYLEGSLNQLLHDLFPDMAHQINRILQSTEKIILEKNIKHKGGGDRYLTLTLFPAENGSHLLTAFLDDQTQSRQQEASFRQNQKLEAIGKLAGGVAHDFNNILAIMEGYARMAESGWKRGDDITENLRKIYSAIERGSGLTRQLLTFGKHRIAENKTIDLGRHVRETQTLLAPLLGATIKLVMDIPDRICCVKSTPDVVSQIVMNLSINARDAMPEGGVLTIKLYPDDTQSGFWLTVSDTGTGIPPEVMDRMFDPFFTTKEQGKGTGLGLSMVYGLIQQMGGKLDVTTEKDQGSRFSIWLPQSDEPVAENNAGEKSSAEESLQGKTVVLAEDEPDLLEIMKQTLESFGMQVLKAANGNEALEIQDEYDGQIDFLLTDMVMPELGGLELADLFHLVRPEAHIVFMSGYPVRGEISEINLPDDAVFMAKPVMQDNLKMIMENVMLGKKIHAASGVVWE